jgi:hypothetical protein
MSWDAKTSEAARVSRETTFRDTHGAVIYDFGLNIGDNIEYYLKKGFKVVGVDANLKLCGLCGKRFAKEVAEGRLVILNFVLSGHSSPELAVSFQ